MKILPVLRSRKNIAEKGQALLIILLTMSVVLIVSMSAASRSITDIAVTTYEEEAQRAFDAAEAGIEEVLIAPNLYPLPTQFLPNQTEYYVDVEYPIPQGGEFSYPADLLSGESATFWFVSHDPATARLRCGGGAECLRALSLNVCWGKPGTPVPAIEVSVYYDTTQQSTLSGNFANVKIARRVFDPVQTRSDSNNFQHTTETCPITGKAYEFATGDINLASLGIGCANSMDGCLLMAKVRMFYNNTFHPLGIQASGAPANLPAQGVEIASTGVSGQSTRRVKVFQGYPEPPFVFDSAVFSRGDIEK